MERLIAERKILWPSKSDGRPRLKRFLNEIRSHFTGFSSVQDVGYTTDGTREIRELLGAKVLAFPKPVSLMRMLLQQVTDANDLMLDFFAGSCTMAQAVLKLNHQDGGNRKFIMVQLPEPTGNTEYQTIAEIGKERIRRVIAKLKAEAAERLPFEHAAPASAEETLAGAACSKHAAPASAEESLAGAACSDLGFKVFKLAKPNIEQWVPDSDRNPDNYAKKLGLFDDPLVPGWTPENVLWEVALREGFGLNSTFEKKTLAGAAYLQTIYEITDPDKDPPQTIAVCLDEQVRVELSKHYPLNPDTLLICRDKALDDTAAANLALQCRLKTI